MVNKIRVTINLDQDVDILDEMGSPEHGVYGIDEDGVYHMYYGSKSYLCVFTDRVQLNES